MSRLATRAEILKLARVLRLDAATLEFLRGHSAEHIRRLREAVYELLYVSDKTLFKRLTRILYWLPAPVLAFIAPLFSPVIVARVAGEFPAKFAAAVCERLPIGFLADAAAEFDPRGARDLLRRLPAQLIRDAAIELNRRSDYVTLGRFVDYVSDEAIHMILEAIDDDVALLRLSYYTESKNRLDHVVQMLPDSRISRILCLAQDDVRGCDIQVLAILTQVSHGLKRKLGDLLVEQPEAVLSALLRACQREGLWPELLPFVAAMSPAGLCTVVNQPALLDPAMLESIGRAADASDLWGVVLPMVEMMDDTVRTAVAQSMARRGGAALPSATNAALVGEHWESLLDIVARMPENGQREFAQLVAGLGEADTDLSRRISDRAAAHGFGAAFSAAENPALA